MRTLVGEDDFTSRVVLKGLLRHHGPVDVATNGREVVNAAHVAISAGDPYDLICLDILMPEMDGQEALKRIRQLEQEAGIAATRRARVFMTTALADKGNVLEAIRGQCDAFLVKPIDSRKLIAELRRLNLIE